MFSKNIKNKKIFFNNNINKKKNRKEIYKTSKSM